MNKRSLYAVTAAAGLVLSLAACGSDDGGDTGSDGTGGDGNGGDAASFDLVTDGTLTVCSDVPYVPFEDFDTSAPSGFSGFDIDIVSYIAEGLDLDLVVKDSSFEGLQSGLSLNAGECDLAASAMTITEDRKQNLDFSDGYYDSLQSLLVPEGSDIAAIGDLAGKKVGVQQGTTGEAYTQENAADAEIIAFPSNAEMFQAIQAGQVDALLQDLPVNVDNANKSDGEFTIVEEYDTDEQYGFAFAKGEKTELREAINAALQELRDNGTYQEIYDSYFSAN